jgi:hypothetical protein
MNAKQWNVAMFSAMIALALIAVPFFAIAGDIDFGGFSDINFGGDSGMGFGGLSGIDFGGASGIDFSGFSGIDGSSGTGTATGSQTTGTAGTGGFDPFDGNLGPFTGIPGDIPGDDINHPPNQPLPCEITGTCPIVPCEQIGTCPVPTPTPSPSPSSSDDSLQIFIHSIFLNDPFDQLSGDQVALRITFQNTGANSLYDTKGIIMIPDISARVAFGPMDVHAGETVTSTVLLDLPEDAQPGVYPVRLQIYNQDAQRVVHRELEIIDYP